MNNSIYKIIILLFLSLMLFNCNKDERSNTTTNNGYYVTAKIIRNGETIDYNKTDGLMVIKAVANGLEFESFVFGTEDPLGYNLNIGMSRQTEIDGEPLPEQNIVLAVTKKENGEDLYWMSSMLFGHNGSHSIDGDFSITKETDTYMEGTFNFKASLMTSQVIDPNNIVEVTNGKFKVQKLNY